MTKLFKQLMPFILGCFFTLPAFTQSTAPVLKTTGSTLSPDRSKMLCKAWQLDTISEFGTDNKAEGKNAHDAITFGSDGSFFMTQDGTVMSGSWSCSGDRITVETVSPDKNKLNFQIISLSGNRLVLAYQFPAPDLTKVQYTYSPKKQE